MFWDLFWFLLVAVYVVSYVFVLIFVISDLFRDDSVGGWGKAAWIFFLIFFPVLAAIIALKSKALGHQYFGA